MGLVPVVTVHSAGREIQPRPNLPYLWLIYCKSFSQASEYEASFVLPRVLLRRTGDIVVALGQQSAVSQEQWCVELILGLSWNLDLSQ